MIIWVRYVIESENRLQPEFIQRMEQVSKEKTVKIDNLKDFRKKICPNSGLGKVYKLFSIRNLNNSY